MIAPRRWAHPAGELGTCTLLASDAGIVALVIEAWRDQDHGLPATVDGAGAAAERHLRAAATALDHLVAGRAPTALPAFDLRALPAFTAAVLRATAAIPWGRTLTYGQVAELVGKPRAARAVGQAVGRNPIPVLIPCHRVLGSGWAGGFGPGLAAKAALCAREGIALPSASRAGWNS